MAFGGHDMLDFLLHMWARIDGGLRESLGVVMWLIEILQNYLVHGNHTMAKESITDVAGCCLWYYQRTKALTNATQGWEPPE